MIRRWIPWLGALLVLAWPTTPAATEEFTRGVGVYPGRPNEDLAPRLVPGPATTTRNLAQRRPAYQSSAYDYNLTAQLVTDGIRQTTPPRWLATTTSADGLAPKTGRETLLDHNSTSTITLAAPRPWVQFELAGGATPFEIDRLELEARLRPPARPATAGATDAKDARQWTLSVAGSEDGTTWRELGRAAGPIPPPAAPAQGLAAWFGPRGPALRPSLTLDAPARSRFYRVTVDSTGGESWTIAEVAFYRGQERIAVGGPYHFDSAWMPEGTGPEWVSVDLGARSTIERVALHWIQRPASASLEVSDDGSAWRPLPALPLAPTSSLVDTLALPEPTQARHVRLRVTGSPTTGRPVLSELEVLGRGGLVPQPAPRRVVRADGRLDLAGGDWRLERHSNVAAAGPSLAKPGFADGDWLLATVPATVLSSYWNAGALPDPNYGDNQLALSDAFFYADFWYRTEFPTPASYAGRRVWLNFDGVNWKAEVFLNGERLGRIEGAFTRGRFDVTERLKPGATNALAIRIERNATPGSIKQKTLETAGLNGGGLGADNPTYHASIGWDWIPAVRGRNIGLWNDVFLTSSGPVTLEDPYVRTTLPLPDTSRADVRLEATLRNHTAAPVSGALLGRFGTVSFSQPVVLEPASAKTIVLDPTTHPALRLDHPRLWWPAGYGAPDLYDVELRFEAAGAVSDQKSFAVGVRQYTYSEDGGALKIWINGRRLVGRGGNWGFPETNLRYRGREYDVAVRYHRDMNFTMIRNWVGQTGDDELFEACDRHGIVIWQDFWLANPVDGPDPDDNELFLANARDFLLRLRNHASLGLYCGRNEGDPPAALDAGLRRLVAELQPEVRYISNSASGVVSGGGPYAVQPTRFYFLHRATPRLHSELGMPNIPTLESVRAMMPETALWPQGLMWGLHDFNLRSAQGLAGFRRVLDQGYGGAENVADWVRLAQLVNYDGYRAMFEAQGKNRMGLLLWMSHPCWPSFVWQTYDYYFDPTAAYFGSKKGSEPLHVQWNPLSDTVEVVNYSAGAASGLSVRAEILNLDGSQQWTQTASVDSAEDSLVTSFPLQFPAGLTPVHFVRLKLTQGTRVVSENLYWRGLEEGSFQALRTLATVTLEVTTSAWRQGDEWLLTTSLRNRAAHPALMVRLVAVRAKSGDRILPALYSDNYVTLMPGESRTIETRLEQADTRGGAPRIVVEGFNVGEGVTRLPIPGAAGTAASATVATAPKVVVTPRPAVDLKPGQARYTGRFELGGQTAVPISATRTITAEGGAWRVSEAVQMPMGEVTDNTVLEKGSLILLRRSLRQGPTEVNLEVKGGKVTGTVGGGANATPIALEVGGPLFGDGAGGQDVLAALPLAEGYATYLRTFDVQSAKAAIKQARVAGSEPLTVGTRAVETWRVEVTSADGEPGGVTLWVARDSRQVVKSVTRLAQWGGITITLELQP